MSSVKTEIDLNSARQNRTIFTTPFSNTHPDHETYLFAFFKPRN